MAILRDPRSSAIFFSHAHIEQPFGRRAPLKDGTSDEAWRVRLAKTLLLRSTLLRSGDAATAKLVWYPYSEHRACEDDVGLV
jgi:hypothetical protein